MWDAYIPDIIPPKRPDDDGSQPKARIDGTMLHRQLASLRDITGKYMFSDPLYDPSAGKPPLEASCFDPGYCDCIHLAGSEDLPQHLKLAEPERKTSWKEWQGGQHSCSTSALSDNFPLHLRRSPYHPGPTFIQTVSVYSPPEFPGALCVEYNSSFDISFDDDPAKTLQLRRSGPLGRCSLEWMMALDPESYDIESDHEGLNVFWCRQPECANYFRSITRLGSDDDHTKPCPRLCH
ncbi:hypothetical protein MCOR25_008368 [Pyricularia grisea]|nr:hypothetical protein MCOR25_008368 [Pyricularia grisea]